MFDRDTFWQTFAGWFTILVHVFYCWWKDSQNTEPSFSVLFLYWLAVLDPGHRILSNFRHYQLAFEDLTARPLHTLQVIWLSAPLQVYTSFCLLNLLTCVPDSLIGLFQKNFNGCLVCPGTEPLTCLVGEERWARSSQTSLSLLPSAFLGLFLNSAITYGD